MFQNRADEGKLKLEYPTFQKFKLRYLPCIHCFSEAVLIPQKGHKIPLSKPKSVLTEIIFVSVVFLTGSAWLELLFVVFLMNKKSFRQEFCAVFLLSFIKRR